MIHFADTFHNRFTFYRSVFDQCSSDQNAALFSSPIQNCQEASCLIIIYRHQNRKHRDPKFGLLSEGWLITIDKDEFTAKMVITI